MPGYKLICPAPKIDKSIELDDDRAATDFVETVVSKTGYFFTLYGDNICWEVSIDPLNSDDHVIYIKVNDPVKKHVSAIVDTLHVKVTKDYSFIEEFCNTFEEKRTPTYEPPMNRIAGIETTKAENKGPEENFITSGLRETFGLILPARKQKRRHKD